MSTATAVQMIGRSRQRSQQGDSRRGSSTRISPEISGASTKYQQRVRNKKNKVGSWRLTLPRSKNKGPTSVSSPSIIRKQSQRSRLNRKRLVQPNWKEVQWNFVTKKGAVPRASATVCVREGLTLYWDAYCIGTPTRLPGSTKGTSRQTLTI